LLYATRLRITTIVVLGAFLAAMTLGPATAFAAPQKAPLGAPIPVTGTLVDPDTGTDKGSFSGNIVGGALSATGEFSGTLVGTATFADGTTQQVSQKFSQNVAAQQQQQCQILFLDLGPIFLDLLGLQVDLSPIQLDVTAVTGPGNLLGNLLCELVGALD
jgi:hypothetical protein